MVFVRVNSAGILCPANSVRYRGYCYLLSDMTANFTDARLECGKFPGGDVAMFQTKQDYEFLVALKRYVFYYCPQTKWQEGDFYLCLSVCACGEGCLA